MAVMEETSKKTKSEKVISVALLLVLLIALVGMGAWAMKIVSSHLKATSPSFARRISAGVLKSGYSGSVSGESESACLPGISGYG